MNLILQHPPTINYRNIFWNETGNLVCLATDECYFILRVDTGAIQTAIDAKQGLGEDGLEDAFEVSFLLHCAHADL